MKESTAPKAVATALLDSGDPGLALLEVDTGPLRAVFLPSVGGRLLSLRVDGHELLWVNPRIFDTAFRALVPRSAWPAVDGSFSSWTNVGGSKTWPAPQGWDGNQQWAGPPDAVLDSGQWSLTTTELPGELTVTMVSPHDPRTGLCITREFTFTAESTSFHETIRFLNISNRKVQWSAWEVVQTDTSAGGVVEVRVSSDAPPIDLGRYAGTTEVSVADGIARLRVAPGVAKVGFPSATGHVAWSGADGGILQLTVRVDEDAFYPDGGSRVELWTQSPLQQPLGQLDGFHPDAWLVEMEVLSPLHRLGPGESADFAIKWNSGSRAASCERPTNTSEVPKKGTSPWEDSLTAPGQ
ncbi:hypothetical protein ACS5PJ_04840 [Pseudarthrobacter sp. YS3]|uniref:hypothetical protein n=1 Tax=Pseudarthrobacter sp. YS3 TaxID=3453718 RepID=UPI003EEDC3F7